MKNTLALGSVLAASALLLGGGCSSSVETEGTTSGHSTSSSSASSASSASSSSASSSSSSGAGGGAPSDVVGTLVYRYLGEGAPLDQPADLSGAAIAALVQQGGGWQTINGSGKADGSFEIPGVPAGPFLLSVAGSYVYTSARTLDLGTDVAGRPDAMYGQPSTQIAGVLQSLAPWSDLNTVEWLDANASGAGYGFAMATPAAGDTSLTGQPASWYGALVDGSMGDVLYATQLEQMGNGAPYSIVTRFTSWNGVEQQDGATTTVNGAFTAVAADQVVTIDFYASAFAYLATAINPAAMDEGTSVDLSTMPGAGSDGSFGLAADLLTVYPGDTDVNLGPVHYANPFPAAWGTSLYAGETVAMSYMVPGATTAGTVYGFVSVVGPPAQLGAGPIKPQVGPVQAPQVNGLNAFGPLSGISATPTLTWLAPSIGQATGYRVTVYQLQNMAGTTTPVYVAALTTTETTMVLPPGVLVNGSAYAFQITALDTSVDLATKPFGDVAAYASADVLTSMATP